ncbi:hypothetical protein [Propionivibrio dicarboxylicus]|uniref:Uncharacterized protein n=1 Tax=Propionivibrio dicarboxylicus TaxID=83767 RepID=A0A1G8KZ69_9RHOO|nr:hypothetical protein [Propionivibrio dicarboxylicus]SDI48673.1 hypothetical protein SAMN05660652_03519 [Propionivibrio dicarboxylicus]
MKMRNVCLAPSRATPGMTLTSPVNGRDGLPLLAAGTTIDGDTIERLIRRGVETIWVEIPDERDARTIAIELEAADHRIATIFRGRGSPAREALREAVIHYRRESLQ